MELGGETLLFFQTGRRLFRMTGILFVSMTAIVVFCSTIFIWAFLRSPANHSLQSCVGRALQGFTSSALVPNTVALPIPNADEKIKIFLLIFVKSINLRAINLLM